MREFTGFMWIADTMNRAGSLEPEKLLEAAVKTFTRPKDMIIDYAGIKFDQNQQNILAGGVVAQIGWDGDKPPGTNEPSTRPPSPSRTMSGWCTLANLRRVEPVEKEGEGSVFTRF